MPTTALNLRDLMYIDGSPAELLAHYVRGAAVAAASRNMYQILHPVTGFENDDIIEAVKLLSADPQFKLVNFRTYPTYLIEVEW